MNYRTPLQAGVKKNCGYNVSSCLLGFGADLNHQDVAGRTPLHGFFNESARTIIEFHQEDLDNTTQDSRGMNIAHCVSRSKSSLPADLFRCCRGNISSLVIADEEGKTALHFACQRGNLELLEHFLNNEYTTISRPDWRGRTLMHYATESSRSVQTINMLECRGFDARAVDHQGRTVLHHAASAGSVVAVEKLIKLGAAEDLNALDNESRTPLQVAALCGRKAVVELLRPLCDDTQVSTLLREQVTMGHRGRRKNLKIRLHLSAFVSALLGFGLLVTSLILHFMY